MRALYASWEPQIREFFSENNLDYAKVKKCGKAVGIIGGKRTLLLQNIEVTSARGLLDETPAPVVLKAVEENGKLIFETTPYTSKYFH